jgi:hypothetical protein
MTGQDTRAYVQDGREDHVINVYCDGGLRLIRYAAIDRGLFIESAEAYAARRPTGPGFSFDHQTGLTLYAYSAQSVLLTTIALRRLSVDGGTVFQSILSADQTDALRAASYIVGLSGPFSVEWSGDGSARRIDAIVPMDGEPC